MKTDYIVTISGNDILSGGGLYADLATYTSLCSGNLFNY